MIVGIAILVFGAVGFMAMAFALESHSRRMSDRFTVVAPSPSDDEVPEAVSASFRERVLDPIFGRANDFMTRLTPKASMAEMVMRLDRAGRPWGLTPGMWSLMRTSAAVGGTLAALVAMKALPLDGLLPLCVAAIVAFAGILGPSFMLDQKIKQRQMEIRRSLPDVIDLLVVSVEAGLGLDASVQEVIKRRRGPLMDEFARVLTEIRVGKSRRTAWQEMSARVDVLELKVFVAALIQAEELGSSIAGVLNGQSEALRVRRSLMVREVAAMLPVKMLFPLIFFIFPAVFVVILGPGMISLVDTFKQIGF